MRATVLWLSHFLHADTSAPGPACAPIAGPVSTSQPSVQSMRSRIAMQHGRAVVRASQWPTITRQRLPRGSRRAT